MTEIRFEFRQGTFAKEVPNLSGTSSGSIKVR